ncbi:MAG: alpha/beta fold hydrolase, partial [Anaerolineales bacterium]
GRSMTETPAAATRSPFKTVESADRYRAAYAATLALWPVPHAALDIPTRFGTTHVNAAGESGLPPLILIHGFAASSTQWYPNIAALSGRFRVYALDVVNQMGLSVSTRPLKTRADCAGWLIEVMDGLELERAAVAGHSYGGWLSLNLALAAPERVERLVLLSPAAAIAPLAMRFLVSFLLVFIRPSRRRLYRFMQSLASTPLVEGEAMVEQLVAAIPAFRPTQQAGPVVSKLSDQELRRLSMPVLLLVGEQDITCQPRRVIERARRLIPRVRAELIMGGGHLFTFDRPAATAARVLEFLGP